MINEQATEIERKFLLANLPAGLSRPSLIEQGYLVVDDEGNEVRLRDEKCKGTLAVKRGRGRVREQYEVELHGRQFFRLWRATEGRRLRKKRRRMEYAGLTIEVDQYLDELASLLIAEVEFPTDEASQKFVPLDWFGTEVTDRPEYSNQNLALYGLPSRFAADLYDLKRDRETRALAEQLGEAASKADGCFIVLIAGGSASGKSHLGKRLSQLLGDRAILISADDYYRGIEFMRAEAAKGNHLSFDQPEVIDHQLLADHLDQLARGETIDKPIYDFASGRRIGQEPVRPSRIILVEGLFVLAEPVGSRGSFKIFVEADTHGRIVRRLLRDVAERGQKPADVLRYFAQVVEPMHRKYIESVKAKADLVIDSGYRPEIEAARSGGFERQLKFEYNHLKILTPDQVMRGVERLGPTIEQSDHYYNPANRDLGKTGELLRIRHENDRLILTYKGPKTGPKGAGTPVADRPKFECEIDEPTERAIERLYDGRGKAVEKRRTFYHFRGLLFSHDLLWTGQNETSYLEFRFGSNPADDRILDQLLSGFGLKREEAITKSYVELV